MALHNILVVSAVWVLGGLYLHEARVLCPAGPPASARPLTGRAKEEMTQQVNAKTKTQVPTSERLTGSGAIPSISAESRSDDA